MGGKFTMAMAPKLTIPTTDSADVEEGDGEVAKSHWWRLKRSEILRPQVSMAPLDWIPAIGRRWCLLPKFNFTFNGYLVERLHVR